MAFIKFLKKSDSFLAFELTLVDKARGFKDKNIESIVSNYLFQSHLPEKQILLMKTALSAHVLNAENNFKEELETYKYAVRLTGERLIQVVQTHFDINIEAKDDILERLEILSKTLASLFSTDADNKRNNLQEELNKKNKELEECKTMLDELLQKFQMESSTSGLVKDLQEELALKTTEIENMRKAKLETEKKVALLQNDLGARMEELAMQQKQHNDQMEEMKKSQKQQEDFYQISQEQQKDQHEKQMEEIKKSHKEEMEEIKKSHKEEMEEIKKSQKQQDENHKKQMEEIKKSQINQEYQHKEQMGETKKQMNQQANDEKLMEKRVMDEPTPGRSSSSEGSLQVNWICFSYNCK